MNTCYQDWEPVVIRSTNAVNLKNKKIQGYTALSSFKKFVATLMN